MESKAKISIFAVFGILISVSFFMLWTQLKIIPLKHSKIMECRVIQGISTVLKDILERSFGAQNVKT
jgi:hypothetical protein